MEVWVGSQQGRRFKREESLFREHNQMGAKVLAFLPFTCDFSPLRLFQYPMKKRLSYIGAKES